MSDWQPIDTAPENRTILLFAVTDVDDDGKIRNWKMATGCRYPTHPNYPASARFDWDGRAVMSWETMPTHWMPLPAPPKDLP